MGANRRPPCATPQALVDWHLHISMNKVTLPSILLTDRYCSKCLSLRLRFDVSRKGKATLMRWQSVGCCCSQHCREHLSLPYKVHIGFELWLCKLVSIFSSYLYALTVSKEGVDVVTKWQLSSRAQIRKKEAAKQVGAESFFFVWSVVVQPWFLDFFIGCGGKLIHAV